MHIKEDEVNLIEEGFKEESKQILIARAKLSGLIGIVLFPIFGFLDLAIFPDHFILFLKLRILVAIFLVGTVFLLNHTSIGKLYASPLGMTVFLSVGLTILYMIHTTGGYLSTYYAGINFVVLVMALIMPWGIQETSIVCSIFYFLYLAPILLFQTIERKEIFINNNYFMVSTILIAILASFLGEKLRRKEFTSRFNLVKAREQLEENVQKLQEMDRIKTDFFANISHELRTPLTLILAPLESMLHRKEMLPENMREDLSSMYQNGLRLLKLINNLLDLAKIDAGKMRLSYTKTDFTKFIRGTIASVAPLAEKKDLSLSFTCPDPLDEFYFDRDKLEKVLLNLIFNSIKFTNREGKVIVSCERSVDQVIVKVTDTGIGIAEENIHKLFNRFSQVETSSSRRFEGTGIGLALSRELIELHKGEIWAESKLGQGTTITFTIPYLENPICIPDEKDGREADWTRSLHKAAEYSTAGIIQEVKPTVTQARNSTPGSPKILVVEDNHDMLHFIVSQLQNDYQVITAHNGVEGIMKAKSELPSLILSDVMMPIKDGYQLCREVKEDPSTKHIPVVLITAKADLSMKIEGLEHGADDYLTKPFSCDELRARIKSLLNQRGLEAQLIHSEKMAALGLLVAGMAHEINNPISFAKVSLENLNKTLTERDHLLEEGIASDSIEMKLLNDKLNRSFSIIKTGLDRTEAIISDLKAFVRKDEAQFRLTDLHEGLDSTLSLIKAELGNRITIIKEYGEIDLIEAVPGQINQVFMNLLQNAIHAISERGEIRIKTWKEQEWVKISVKDSGTGISPEHQKRIFEPFFTTKEVGKGTGLGLSVSYRILQSHGGEITVSSQPGQGTEFVITLPVRQSPNYKEIKGVRDRGIGDKEIGAGDRG